MTAARAPLVRIDGLAKSFGAAAAVDGVSLDIADGEFVCLLGPSGCGKSTLLRLLAGFEQPDAGTIVLDGRDLAGVPPHRRPLNMMFQSYALFPHLSVAANVGYGLRRARLPRRDVAARVAEMLRLVRLEELGHRYPDQISGGQRQRVALARALARRPRLLLLDEPLGALDRALRKETQAELKALQSGLGTAFVVVTHDAEEALTTADRVGIMDRGRLVQVGTPREVYERPRSRFVAGLLGDANLLEGRVEACLGGRCRVVLDGGDAVLEAASEGSHAVGEPVAVMVRPERVALLDGSAPESDGALRGRVASAEFRGPSVQVRLVLAGGQEIRASRPNDGRTGAEAGAELRVVVPPDAATVLA